MKLYHGTSATIASHILTAGEGLVPRGEGENKWGENLESRPDQVYLTTAYAPYFAMCRAEASEDWAIIEVDTDLLDAKNMRPDEDFVEQASREGPESYMINALAGGNGMVERTAWLRDNIDAYAHHWEDSIRGLGNCAHRGTIPMEAITKIVLFDPESNKRMAFSIDPTISLMNYMFVGARYRAITRWFAGEEITPQQAAGLEGVTGDEEILKQMTNGWEEALQLRDGLKVIWNPS